MSGILEHYHVEKKSMRDKLLTEEEIVRRAAEPSRTWLLTVSLILLAGAAYLFDIIWQAMR